MKFNYLFIMLVIVLIISCIGIFLIMENFELKDELQEISTSNKVIAINNNETTLEKKIIKKSNDPRYKVKAYYPYTPYNKLNKAIEKKINVEIESLIEIAKENTVQPNQYYTIDINYEHYNYDNYLSYVFYTSTYTGGAHPNNIIWSISYDIKNNKVINIDDLVEEYPNILQTMSKESRAILKKDKRFNEQADILIPMLEDGTTPTKENFRNFAFDSNGLIIFFEQYQVAPYSFGTFEVTIPYSKLF